jgi:hypothetical protein
MRRTNSEIGAIAQLGERLHGMQEVSGSIPLGSTNLPLASRATVGKPMKKLKKSRPSGGFFLLPNC